MIWTTLGGRSSSPLIVGQDKKKKKKNENFSKLSVNANFSVNGRSRSGRWWGPSDCISMEISPVSCSQPANQIRDLLRSKVLRGVWLAARLVIRLYFIVATSSDHRFFSSSSSLSLAAMMEDSSSGSAYWIWTISISDLNNTPLGRLDPNHEKSLNRLYYVENFNIG